jgi:NADH:ubiquinone reductase (non-electrogenic)
LPFIYSPTLHVHLLDHLVLNGSDGSIFAIGDCTSSAYAPTAQVASQQGAYLARVLKQMAKRDALQAELNALKLSPTAEKPESNEASVNLQEDIRRLEKQVERAGKFRPFHYSHQGSLA